MSGDGDSDLRPRLCILRKTDSFNGFGFNLHAEKGRAGQYIGKVDDDSPAHRANLKQGDRIIEVDGVNIGNENHQQVVSRIKASGEVTTLLVVDTETDKHYKENKIVIISSLPEVVTCDSASPQTTKIDNDDIPQTEADNDSHPSEMNGHAGLTNGYYSGPATVDDDGPEEIKPTEQIQLENEPKPESEPEPEPETKSEPEPEPEDEPKDEVAVENDYVNEPPAIDHDYVNVQDEIRETQAADVEGRDEAEDSGSDTREPAVIQSSSDVADVEAVEAQHEVDESRTTSDMAGEDEVKHTSDESLEIHEVKRDEESVIVAKPDLSASEPSTPEIGDSVSSQPSSPVVNGENVGFTGLTAKQLRAQLAERKRKDIRSQKVDFREKRDAFESI